jgi:Fe-S-cluster containining protein
MKDEASCVITKQTPLAYVQKLSGTCEKCGHCCSYDSGIFLPEDIRRAADSMGMPESEFTRQLLEERILFGKKVHKAKLMRKKGKPFGACVFHADGCKIHEHKPLHCKISTGCKEHGREISIWYFLNYIVDPQDPVALREWEIYLQTHPTIPGGELHELVPDKELRDKLLRRGG